MIKDQTVYSEETLFKFRAACHKQGMNDTQVFDLINECLNAGLLFRERDPNPAAYAKVTYRNSED